MRSGERDSEKTDSSSSSSCSNDDSRGDAPEPNPAPTPDNATSQKNEQHQDATGWGVQRIVKAINESTFLPGETGVMKAYYIISAFYILVLFALIIARVAGRKVPLHLTILPSLSYILCLLQLLFAVAKDDKQFTRITNERKRAETLLDESILIQHVTLDMLKRAEAEREAVRKDAVEVQEAFALLKDAWGLLGAAVQKLESERSVLAARC